MLFKFKILNSRRFLTHFLPTREKTEGFFKTFTLKQEVRIFKKKFQTPGTYLWNLVVPDLTSRALLDSFVRIITPLLRPGDPLDHPRKRYN